MSVEDDQSLETTRQVNETVKTEPINIIETAGTLQLAVETGMDTPEIIVTGQFSFQSKNDDRNLTGKTLSQLRQEYIPESVFENHIQIPQKQVQFTNEILAN